MNKLPFTLLIYFVIFFIRYILYSVTLQFKVVHVFIILFLLAILRNPTSFNPFFGENIPVVFYFASLF